MNVHKLIAYGTVVALSMPEFVFAQCPPECVNEGSKLVNPLRFESIGAFLMGAVQAFATIAGVIGVMGILYSGFLFVTAQGNEQKLSDAKRAFLYSVIGLGIVIGATVLAAAIQATINSIRV